jgi:isoleucyl-tRNA synthetase
MPYSTACGTPLSNFEAGLNYKDVEDLTLTVGLPVVGWDPVHSEQGKAGAACPLVGCSLLAWTTTPWTLPSNLSLCVNETFEYVRVKELKSGAEYVLLESRLVQLYPQMAGKKWKPADSAKLFEVVARFPGKDLVGLKYEPLFTYFAADYGARAFRVLSDPYVTADSGKATTTAGRRRRKR